MTITLSINGTPQDLAEKRLSLDSLEASWEAARVLRFVEHAAHHRASSGRLGTWASGCFNPAACGLKPTASSLTTGGYLPQCSSRVAFRSASSPCRYSGSSRASRSHLQPSRSPIESSAIPRLAAVWQKACGYSSFL